MSNDNNQSLSASQSVTELTTGNKKAISISSESIGLLLQLLNDKRRECQKEAAIADRGGEQARAWGDYMRKELALIVKAEQELCSGRIQEPQQAAGAHGAMLVTDVRLTRNADGLCLVAVRSPLVGWQNVIQDSGEEISRSVNLSDVHGAA